MVSECPAALLESMMETLAHTVAKLGEHPAEDRGKTADLSNLTVLSTLSNFSMESLLFILGALPLPLVWFRLDDGQVVFLNRAFQEVFGYPSDEVLSWSHWSSRFPDAGQREQAIRQWYAQTRKRKSEDASSGLPVEAMEITVLARDGSERTVLHSGVVLPALNCALAIYIDITKRKQDELRLVEAEHAAREREVLYPILLDHTHEMIVISSSDGTRRFVSPAVLPITGWTQAEYLSRRLEDMVHPEDRETLLACRGRCLEGATGEQLLYRSLRRDGSYLWMEALASCYKDPVTQKTLGYIATIRDASQKQAEEQEREARTALLEQQARFDQLTGVANRHVFHSALRDESRRQTRRTQTLALLLIDVDHFKLYNDRYGHLEGDRVLRRIAEILKVSASRVADLVARFGGEEFVLLLPMTDPDGAVKVARNTLAAVAAAAIPHQDSPLGCVTISIGVACWPATAPLDRELLMLQADKALYSAKGQGRNTFFVEHCCSPAEADRPSETSAPACTPGLVPERNAIQLVYHPEEGIRAEAELL